MIKYFLMLAILSGCSNQAPKELNLTAFISDAMDQKNSAPFSGVILIDVQDWRIVDRVKTYKNIPVSKDDQFVLGDLSKQITAAIVLKLVDDGKLSLNAPVSTYMPELGNWAKKITIHHLLNHTSGMGEGMSIVGKTGNFLYSNGGYDLLGKITARIEAKTFPQQVKAIAKMCGMQDTFANEKSDVFFLKSLHPGFNQGWIEDKKGAFARKDMPKDESQNPSLGIISTPEDMMKWSKCLHTGDLLSPSSYQKMITPGPRFNHRWSEDAKYGYGLQIQKSFGSPEISHSGKTRGFKSTMIYYPNEQTHVVIMENISLNNSTESRDFGMHDRIRKVVIDRILTPPVID